MFIDILSYSTKKLNTGPDIRIQVYSLEPAVRDLRKHKPVTLLPLVVFV